MEENNYQEFDSPNTGQHPVSPIPWWQQLWQFASILFHTNETNKTEEDHD